MKKLDLELLNQACSGDGAALRIRTKLLPVGGSDDKIFPPTYAGENHAVYAVENRRVDGREVRTILLDSVQSQANRLEEALLRAVEEKRLNLPLLEVNFPKAFEGRNKVTSLEAPHRIADALIRDSLVINENKTPFAKSNIGKRFSASTYANATALFEYCPTALIFGVWDSHGSGGGLGNKFARALVSEIVGFDAVEGVRTGGRLDPYNTASKIEERIYQHKDPKKKETANRSEAAVDDKGNPVLMRIEGKIFKHEDPELKWTFDPNEAEKDDKGKPLMVGKDVKEKGKPAAIGHGNIPPAVASKETEKGKFEAFSGGVTLSSALQTTVLSFPQLRRLRFPAADGNSSPERNKAGRVVLAALALHAIALQKSDGYLLRSRSQLVPVPKEPPTIKFIDQNGKEDDLDPESFSVEATKNLLDGALAAASRAQLSWQVSPVKMVPSPKLLKLLELSQAGRGEEEAS